jgi:hypothetical protein
MMQTRLVFTAGRDADACALCNLPISYACALCDLSHTHMQSISDARAVTCLDHMHMQMHPQ